MPAWVSGAPGPSSDGPGKQPRRRWLLPLTPLHVRAPDPAPRLAEPAEEDEAVLQGAGADFPPALANQLLVRAAKSAVAALHFTGAARGGREAGRRRAEGAAPPPPGTALLRLAAWEQQVVAPIPGRAPLPAPLRLAPALTSRARLRSAAPARSSARRLLRGPPACAEKALLPCPERAPERPEGQP